MYCTAISQYSLKPAFGLAKTTGGDGPGKKKERPAGLKPGDAAVLFTDGLESAADFGAIAKGQKVIADFFAKAPTAVVNTKLALPNEPTPLMRLVTTDAMTEAQKIGILNAITKQAANKIDFTAADNQGKTVFDHAYAQSHDVFYNITKLLLKRPIAKLTIADVQSAVGKAPREHCALTRSIVEEILDADVPVNDFLDNETSIPVEAALFAIS